MTFRALLLTVVAVFVTLALVIASGPTLEGQETRGKAALLINTADLKEQAPATFKVNFDTSKGPFVVQVHRDWAPIGADRFHTLVTRGYYDGNRFFRVTEIVAQWGINGDSEIAKHWIRAKIPDDVPRKQSNKKGTVAFLQANQRRTQTFVNMIDNPVLDSQVCPVGMVVSGMDVLGRLYQVEVAPHGTGPMLTDIFAEGTALFEKKFPMIDYIKTATIVP